MISWLLSLWLNFQLFFNTGRSRAVPRRPSFRPTLEALEDIIAPADITWTGAGGNVLWSNDNNWSSTTIPGPQDDVTIDGTVSNTASTVDFSFMNSIKSLTIKGGYSKIITLANNLTVGVVGDTETISEMRSGTIYGGGHLTFQGGIFKWHGGTISGIGTTARNVNANVTMEIHSDVVLDAASLNNYGTVKSLLQEKSITLANGARIDNLSNSQFVSAKGGVVKSDGPSTAFFIKTGASFTQSLYEKTVFP